MNTTINFKTKNGDIEMTRDTFVRWLCLIESFYFMEKKAEKLGLNLDKFDWVKPLAFEKYINQRFESMALDLYAEAKLDPTLDSFLNSSHHTQECH